MKSNKSPSTLHTMCAFTPFCEEDAHWLDQYMEECERINIPFVLHFDRCSTKTKDRVLTSSIGKRLCADHTVQDNMDKEYTEQDKQEAMNRVKAMEFLWALHWDIDEVWEKDVRAKFEDVVNNRTEDYLKVAWVNCWNDPEHIRVDTQFNRPPRVKLYNLQRGRKWKFDHPIIYGCKLMDNKGNTPHHYGTCGDTDIVCLHQGLMTRELREFHKARWDRILTTAVGNNQYGFWNLCLDEVNHPPTVVPNPYR